MNCKNITKSFFLMLFLTVVTYGQPSKIKFHTIDYNYSSDAFQGSNLNNTEKVFSKTFDFGDVPWVRLIFKELNLGEGSYLRLVSLKDSAEQNLKSANAKLWKNTSAYFNGGKIKIEIYVSPEDNNISFGLSKIIIGEYNNSTLGPESICGPDDRISSSDNAVGRIMDNGCTAWIIANGKLITAGHCYNGANIVEFNVPPSLPDGRSNTLMTKISM